MSHLMFIAVIAAALFAGITSAQSGSHTIMTSDESGNTTVLQFTAPDIESLSTPDFTHRDLPLFTRFLVLSEEQGMVLGSLIDDYLEAFQAITKELAATAGPEAEFVPEGDRPSDTPTDLHAELSLNDLRDQLPQDCKIGTSIGVSHGSTVDGVAQPPTVEVSITLDSADGDEISLELQEKIRQRANSVADKMVKEFEARQAAEAAGEPVPESPMMGGPGTDFEQMQARQTELMAKVEEFRKAKARLRESFVANAQGTLADDQLPRWPALERALTRDRSLPKGHMSGERVDLVKLLELQKLNESEMQGLAATIEAYELDLDSALKSRDSFLLTANAKIDEFIAERKPDQAISIAERLAALRVAVRSVNHRHAEQLSAAMNQQQAGRGDDFRVAALAEFYPSIPIETRGQRVFAASKKIDTLSVETLRAIEDLQTVYENELAAIFQQLRTTIDREEPLSQVRGLEHLKRSMNNKPRDESDDVDAIRAVNDRRLELDDRYREQVANLLTPEQQKALPKPRNRKGPLIIKSDE